MAVLDCATTLDRPARLGVGGDDLPIGFMPLTDCVRLAAALSQGGYSTELCVISSHNDLLRPWLTGAGIDPEHDVDLCAVPPPVRQSPSCSAWRGWRW